MSADIQRYFVNQAQQSAAKAVKRERDKLVAYRKAIAREVELTERDIERQTGLTIRLDRLRSLLRMPKPKPEPRVGLCRFAR